MSIDINCTECGLLNHVADDHFFYTDVICCTGCAYYFVVSDSIFPDEESNDNDGM